MYAHIHTYIHKRYETQEIATLGLLLLTALEFLLRLHLRLRYLSNIGHLSLEGERERYLFIGSHVGGFKLKSRPLLHMHTHTENTEDCDIFQSTLSFDYGASCIFGGPACTICHWNTALLFSSWGSHLQILVQCAVCSGCAPWLLIN